MKILSVEITNITSIEGPYLINFEDEKFANIGLFGITGPVGAGKSSIIDAICLGLYNTTPFR
ncbi:AAA family ATPase [Flavobacterium agricola]|uniref:AAA family ATPase n=1 Tax=Flavobacterium agricola TaxID=2870839 RepID=A0ABY6M2N9_9FLAO|nr:AAA family ATPase [Flavobacterium agricola]UYW01929.1 AAA family ATPase [Flavobacterium agricola]